MAHAEERVSIAPADVAPTRASDRPTPSRRPVASDDRSLAAIQRAAPLFERVSKETHVLDALQWPRRVEEKFFAKHGRELPEPEYEIDRGRATKNVIALDELAMTLDVGDPVQRWLTQVARSYADGNRLLLAVGTPRFHALSVDVYGGPTSKFDHDSTNLDLANHLAERLGMKRDAAPSHAPIDAKRAPDVAPLLDAEAFGAQIVSLAHAIGLEVEVTLDDDVSAKVVAGMKRVRVRRGATFHPNEVAGLFVHEVETHALTAQNGAAQTHMPFLKSGGPRTTRTQEGLAVFSEFYSHALLVDRMKRIVERVRLVALAEEGASFLDLYRRLVDGGSNERDAYFDAQRICRGGLVEGGAPFTKDAAYLAGFADVFAFLQIAMREGAREAMEILACGRIAIDDFGMLCELRRRGILDPPKYVPRWLQAWEGVLPFFAFASFLHEIDLADVEARHREAFAAARATS